MTVLALGCEVVGEPAPEDAAAAREMDAQQTVEAQPASSADAAPGEDVSRPAAQRDSGVVSPAFDANGPGDAAQFAVADAFTSLADASAAHDGAPTADASSPDLCPDGFARGDASLALARIAPFQPSPEGVAVCPDGEVYVTIDGPDEIRRVPLDGGAPALYASLAGFQPASIACDERGCLFVAALTRRASRCAAVPCS